MYLSRWFGLSFFIIGSFGPTTLKAETCAPIVNITDGPSFNYGGRAINSESVRTFQLVNGGSEPVSLMTAELIPEQPAGAGIFTFRSGVWTGAGTCGLQLPPDSSCSLTVNFKPTAVGETRANLTITYSINAGTPVAVSRPIRGTGRLPMANLSISETAPLGFGAVAPWTTRAKQFLVTNTGELPATGIKESSPSLSEPFSVESSTCGDVLDPQKTCSTTVNFAPRSTGTFSMPYKLAYFQGQTAKSVSRTLTGTSTYSEHRVFVSSLGFNGDLGGYAGANEKCQQLADSARRQGKWVAVLDRPQDILIAAPVLDFKDRRVAGNGADFWTSVLDVALSVNERGEDVSNGSIRTGLKIDGQRGFKSAGPSGICSTGRGPWTSSQNTNKGWLGRVDRTNYERLSWTETGCSSFERLLCISQ